MTINEKLSALRTLMQQYHIDAVIVPSSDAHLSEYVANHWKTREWISGFTGSAGTAVITMAHAGVWTDSRYYLQAEKELAESEFELHKVINYNPDYIPFLQQNLKAGAVVAADAWVISHAEARGYRSALAKYDISLETQYDLIGMLWKDRPAVPQNPIMIHNEAYAGEPVGAKLQKVRDKMRENNCTQYLITALDEIAWLFNLRGNDIDCNPVFIAYAVVRENDAILFTDPAKTNEELILKLKHDYISVQPYASVKTYLEQLDIHTKIYLAGSLSNEQIYTSIPCKIVDDSSLIAIMKAVKNEKEVNNIRQAMKKDGIALVKSFMWLENELKQRKVSEFEFGEKIGHFRSLQNGYHGESFEPIVGYKANGAIVHYSAHPDTCAMIEQEGILLVDSGGQYEDGTTDITRTISLGNPSDDEKKHFTLVLKGHIAVDRLIFPAGISGYQIDLLARQFLWSEGMNYFHGTGHGVGYFLNVHEGPHGISFVLSDRSKTPLQPGMLTSNEPGVYLEGAYGIRIENLILTKEMRETAFGKFLGHESLTLFPIDLKLIDKELMDQPEIDWLNKYHQQVYQILADGLNEQEKSWLEQKCRPL